MEWDDAPLKALPGYEGRDRLRHGDTIDYEEEIVSYLPVTTSTGTSFLLVSIPNNWAAEHDKPDVESQFKQFASTWKSETSSWSSIARRYAHPAYQSILTLGDDAIPLILKSLKQEPDYWFAALRALVKNKPHPVSIEASFDEAVSAWLKFGRDEGHID